LLNSCWLIQSRTYYTNNYLQTSWRALYKVQKLMPAFIMILHFVTLWPWPLTFQPKSIPSVAYPKVIPYTKFEHFGIIRFWVMVQINKHTHTHTHTHTDVDDRLIPMTASAWVTNFSFTTNFHNEISELHSMSDCCTSKPPLCTKQLTDRVQW